MRTLITSKEVIIFIDQLHFYTNKSIKDKFTEPERHFCCPHNVVEQPT